MQEKHNKNMHTGKREEFIMYSVIDVTCEECANIFQGTLSGSFNACQAYITTCPKCENKVAIDFCASFVIESIPKGAAIITPADRT